MSLSRQCHRDFTVIVLKNAQIFGKQLFLKKRKLFSEHQKEYIKCLLQGTTQFC